MFDGNAEIEFLIISFKLSNLKLANCVNAVIEHIEEYHILCILFNISILDLGLTANGVEYRNDTIVY